MNSQIKVALARAWILASESATTLLALIRPFIQLQRTREPLHEEVKTHDT
jgi:hypothetical protein